MTVSATPPAPIRTTASGRRVLETTTDNTSVGIARQADDVDTLQYVREYTVNGIEAVQMRGGRGIVVWDVDWRLVEESDGHLRKLSIIDDGIGMTAAEMLGFLNRMSSSGKELGAGRNHGTGAKISGAAISPAGVIYNSWRHGEGTRVVYHKVPGEECNGEEVYGLQQLRDTSGGIDDFVLPLDDDDKPYLLAEREHGTQVTFLGHHERQDTTQAPEVISEGRQRWLTKALNTRFFRLPDEVAVYVREGNVIKPGMWEPGQLTHIRGMAHFLAERSIASGTVDVGGGRAHWWILDDDQKGRGRAGSEWTSSGHTAALFGDELYEFKEPTHGGYDRLIAFGVSLAKERVVIYVEPTWPIVVANSARTQLKYAAKPEHPKQDLPWDTWADSFRRQMPAEISALQDAIAAQAAGDGKAFIERILKDPRHLRLFSVRPHRPDPRPRAARRASGAAPGDVSQPAANTPTAAPRKTAAFEPHESAVSAPSANATSPAEPGDSVVVEVPVGAADPDRRLDVAEPAPVDDDDGAEIVELRERVESWIPELLWVSVATGTRPPGDLEDAAARWDRADNTLTINGDFRSYTELLDDATSEYASGPGAQRVVEVTVREVYAQQLVEAILHARALEGSGRWTPDRVDSEMLTEGAFTAVAGNRVLMWGYLKKSLGQRLGSRRRLIAPATPRPR